MLSVGQKGVAPSGSRFEVVESSPERVVFERLLRPRTGKGLPHSHEDFVQRWDVIEGTGTAVMDGERGTVGPGGSLEVPLEVAHRDMWNEGPDDLLLRFTLEPQTEFVEAYGAALMHHLENGSANRQDDQPLLQLFVLLNAIPNASWAHGPPRPLQRVVLPLLAGLGRLRGYRATHHN